MTSTPITWLTDAELQARIDRFTDAACDAELRFEATRDFPDYVESEQHWLAVFNLTLEQGRRRHAA